MWLRSSTLLLPRLPPTALHVIPSLIPEAVLGTKEPSEKARSAAFDFIVAMGHKMNQGGVVRRSLVDGMDEDGGIEAKANVEEYLTMVAAGLVGATPHMISATITAISRLVFEFHETIPATIHNEIIETILVFLGSKNREIVKSALGFVKLVVHTLPDAIVRPHLAGLVPLLLDRAHDHKNHFKVKVRHVLERMIRQFGWQDVHTAAGESDAAKVLHNIKKRKDRMKRKKAAAAAEKGDESDAEVPGKSAAAHTGNAFEDVLYGSESEIEDSDDDAPPAYGKRKGKDFSARLRVDDEPMDLLSGAASRVTSMQSQRRRKPGQEASHFKTDTETGKLLIEDSSDDQAAGAGEDVAGTAYREQMTSADGFTRGAGGRVKFNKDTKKRRRENANADEDVEMEDATAGAGKERSGKRRSEAKLGKEFKAKKAGGDVKKGGLDPYAYVPLGQAAKKSNRRDRIGVAGKR